jgi:hypothetical protein
MVHPQFLVSLQYPEPFSKIESILGMPLLGMSPQAVLPGFWQSESVAQLW